MALPAHLVSAFGVLNDLTSAATERPDNFADRFANALTSAIPLRSEHDAYMLYEFNRQQYLSNKIMFRAYVKEMPGYEALVLWTDCDDILEHYQQCGKLILEWDSIHRRFRARSIEGDLSPILEESDDDDMPELELAPDLNASSHDSKTSFHDLNASSHDSKTSSILNSFDKDMDRLYLHMQQRLYQVTQQMNANTQN